MARLSSPLEDVQRRAGAVMVERDGWRLAQHFGSPAGELAVCASGAGLVDRSELCKFELRGHPEAVDGVVSYVSGVQLEPNEVARSGDVLWCSVSPDRLLALCEPAAAFELSERLHKAMLHTPGALLADETEELAALELLGPSAPSVVARLGAWNVETVQLPQPSFAATALGGIPVLLLEQSATRVLALVERDYAERLWRLVEQAGRPYGLSCVGFEAAERFGMVERRLAGPRARPAFA